MKKITLLVVAILLLSPGFVYSQITFIRTYGDPLTNQGGCSVKQCKDGGYIVSGKTEGTHPTNIYILKLDSIGDTLWTRAIGGDWMMGFDVVETIDSNYVISGYHNQTGYFKCVKLTYTGGIVWNNMLNTLAWGQAIQQTFDGGYISVGLQLIKLNQAGGLSWSRNLSYQAMYVIQDPDSGYVISGFRPYSSGSADSIYIEKTDKNGVKVWKKAYPGTHYNLNNPSNNVLQKTSDGGYIISGMVSRSDHSILLLKTDWMGDSLWSKKSYFQEGEGVVQTTDGGYAVCGYDTLNGNAALLKTDSLGNTQWTRVFDLGDDEYFQSVRQTTDKGFILTGARYSFSAGKADVLVVKTDSTGYAAGNLAGIPAKPDNSVFFISPNPAKDHFILSSKNNEGASADLYDLNGRLVKTLGNIPGKNVFVSCQDLKAGTYLVVLRTGKNETIVQKIIIEN